jgi:hypothetical protein
LEKGDPEYYAVGICKVSPEELLDETRYYFGCYKEDLVYTGMNSEFLKHFLVKIMWKHDGKLKGVDDLRKYKDAIMWGAKSASKRLPISFYKMIDKFLGGFKKEHIAEKKKGNVDENSAGPSRWLSSSYYCSGPWIVTTFLFGFGHCCNGLSWPDRLPSILCVWIIFDWDQIPSLVSTMTPKRTRQQRDYWRKIYTVILQCLNGVG